MDDILKKILGNQRPKAMMRDSDGDKVIDILDCKPYNPKEQGWVHDFAKKKYEEIKERRKESASEREEANVAAREERKKQTVKTAVYREQQRGERQRKSPGGFAAFTQGLGTVAAGIKRMAPATRSVTSGVRKKTGMKKVTRYVKTKGGYKKKTYYKPTYAKATPRQSVQPAMSMPNFNFLGSTNNKKKGKSILDFKF